MLEEISPLFCWVLQVVTKLRYELASGKLFSVGGGVNHDISFHSLSGPEYLMTAVEIS